MKGYKVCLDSNRNTKKGIAANSFEDLKIKIEAKFEVISSVVMTYIILLFKLKLLTLTF